VEEDVMTVVPRERSLFFRITGVSFDGAMLHFSLEWSEREEPWETIFASSVVVPGWVDASGQAIFPEEHLERAIADNRQQVTDYLDSLRNPPSIPTHLARVLNRPLCCGPDGRPQLPRKEPGP